MADHFNALTPAEAERLALLLEEIGEVQQAIGKILRHGYKSYDPTRPPGNRQTNREDLQDELGDVHAAIIMMTSAGDLSSLDVAAAALRRIKSAKPFLHHQDGDNG